MLGLHSEPYAMEVKEVMGVTFIVDTYIVGKVLISLKVTVKGQEVGGRRLMKKVLFSLTSY